MKDGIFAMKMKTLNFIIIFLFLAFNVKAQKQLYNYGFEEWVNEGTKNEEPYRWHSFKSSTGPFHYLLLQQVEKHTSTRPGSDGEYSAHIFSRSIVGITVNGNITNARMNAGSMFPSGKKNNNYTQRDSEFCAEIDKVPDSLTVWVCLRTKKEESLGRIMCYVHGDADFVCYTGGWEPYDMICASVDYTFQRTSALDDEIVWKRFTYPFRSYDLCKDPCYILLLFTTNGIPGEGNSGDDMFVDDVYLVYNPTLEANFRKNEFGNEIEIEYVINGTMSAPNLNLPANEVVVQISLDDDFEDFIEIGRKTTDESGTIRCKIPTEFINKDYRIKVMTTNYPMEFIINP